MGFERLGCKLYWWLDSVLWRRVEMSLKPRFGVSRHSGSLELGLISKAEKRRFLSHCGNESHCLANSADLESLQLCECLSGDIPQTTKAQPRHDQWGREGAAVSVRMDRNRLIWRIEKFPAALSPSNKGVCRYLWRLESKMTGSMDHGLLRLG